MDLLPRFYDVNEGSILIDQVDIRDYKIADLRGLIGIVSQESILFNISVLEESSKRNIYLKNPIELFLVSSKLSICFIKRNKYDSKESSKARINVL